MYLNLNLKITIFLLAINIKNSLSFDDETTNAVEEDLEWNSFDMPSNGVNPRVGADQQSYETLQNSRGNSETEIDFLRGRLESIRQEMIKLDDNYRLHKEPTDYEFQRKRLFDEYNFMRARFDYLYDSLYSNKHAVFIEKKIEELNGLIENLTNNMENTSEVAGKNLEMKTFLTQKLRDLDSKYSWIVDYLNSTLEELSFLEKTPGAQKGFIEINRKKLLQMRGRLYNLYTDKQRELKEEFELQNNLEVNDDHYVAPFHTTKSAETVINDPQKNLQR